MLVRYTFIMYQQLSLIPNTTNIRTTFFPFLIANHTVLKAQVCVFPSVKRQDDVKGEQDMAAKKAALLEKRLRREKEAQEKKQQQELDQEQKREAARSVRLS